MTLPMIGQALLSAFLLTFTLSLDDVVLSAFLSGPGATTMPLVIFSRARLGLNPSVNAVATIIIAVVAVGVVVASFLIARNERRRALDAATAQRPAAQREHGAGARLGLAYLCLAAAMAIVGAYVGFSKALVIVFPVFLLAGMRFAIARGGDGAVAAPAGRRAALDARSHRLLFLESFFGNFLFSICMLFGIRQSTALAAGVIMAALPAVVALLSWWLLEERVGVRVAAGIACAIAGIALVAFARDAEGELGERLARRHRPARRRGDLRGALRRHRQEALGVDGPEADQRPHQPVGTRAGRAVRALAAARLLAVVHSRVVVVAAAGLFDRRERRHRVAVDDGPEARAGVVGRDLHRLPAGHRGRGRRVLLRRGVHDGAGAAFALALAGVVLAAWPARRSASVAAVLPSA